MKTQTVIGGQLYVGPKGASIKEIKYVSGDKIKTYQVILDNGDIAGTFDVKDGEKGADGVIGKDGNGIKSIEKTGTSGLVDTYTIAFTNGSSTTFTVTNGHIGKDGKAATITVGTVATGNAGSNAVVTNAGTENAAKFNFTIPKGDKGDKGDTGSVAGTQNGTETGNVVTSVTLDSATKKLIYHKGFTAAASNHNHDSAYLGINATAKNASKLENSTKQEIINTARNGLQPSGNYALKSELFSKDYNELSNKPTIPTNNKQLANGAGYITKAIPLNSKIDLGDTTYFTPSQANLWNSPFSHYTWHDLLSFGVNGIPVVEQQSVSGAWTTVTDTRLTKKPFIQKQSQSITVVNDTIKSTRWTWTSGSFHACNFEWLVVGITYSYPQATQKITFESYVKDIWIKCGEITTDVCQTPIWIPILNKSAGCSKVRVTIERVSETGTGAIAAIKLLTSRWGDQGKGSEYEFPYTWDENKNISGINTLSAVLFKEDGTLLTNKYLGINAKAKDSEKLGGNSASYYAATTGTYPNLYAGGIPDNTNKSWIFRPDYGGANATSNQWLSVFQRDGNNVYLKATPSADLPISTTTQAALNNKLGKTETATAANKVVNPLTITGRDAGTYDGSVPKTINIPNDEAIFSDVIAPNGLPLRSVVINGQIWSIQGNGVAGAIGYEEI